MGRTRAMSRRCFILDTTAEHAVYHDQGEGCWEHDPHKLIWFTSCGATIPGSIFSGACLPRWRADLIARPCKRCYRDG